MQGPTNNPDILASIQNLFENDTWWIYKGETVNRFEQRFARFHDSEYGVSVCNGTIGLEIVLRALEVGPGDKVVLPAYDFYSLPKSVANTGATPFFVDVCENNPTINTELVSNILDKVNVKAVVAVHISGSVAKLDTLAELCSNAGVHLIEDCAQATGAMFDHRHVGSWGIAGIFSFGGVKLMTSGQGGMIVTSDTELSEKCYAIANRGMTANGGLNRFNIIGDNFQMSELAAAMLEPQLDVLDQMCQQREHIMQVLDQDIQNIDGFMPIKPFDGSQVRAQMRYSFYHHLAPNSLAVDDVITIAQNLELPLCRAHKSVPNDERLFQRFARDIVFPNANKVEESLLCVHHSNILLGEDYWLAALKKLSHAINS